MDFLLDVLQRQGLVPRLPVAPEEFADCPQDLADIAALKALHGDDQA